MKSKRKYVKVKVWPTEWSSDSLNKRIASSAAPVAIMPSLSHSIIPMEWEYDSISNVHVCGMVFVRWNATLTNGLRKSSDHDNQTWCIGVSCQNISKKTSQTYIMKTGRHFYSLFKVSNRINVKSMRETGRPIKVWLNWQFFGKVHIEDEFSWLQSEIFCKKVFILPGMFKKSA